MLIWLEILILIGWVDQDFNFYYTLGSMSLFYISNNISYISATTELSSVLKKKNVLCKLKTVSIIESLLHTHLWGKSLDVGVQYCISQCIYLANGQKKKKNHKTHTLI